MERNAVSQVYALLHPVTAEVRYVGVTLKTPRQRLVQHLQKARRMAHSRSSSPLDRWINKLAELGLEPDVMLLQASTRREETERHWIAFYKSQGARLLNLTEGGDGISGLVRSPEHCRKIGDKLRGRKRSPEISFMLSRVHQGKTLSEETRRRMSVVRIGKVQSEATKAKRRATLQGRTYDAVRRANISAGKKKAFAAKQLLKQIEYSESRQH